MIMRVFQVTTHEGKEKEFSKFFRETAIPLMQSVEGIENITFGAARAGSPHEFCIVMVWRDLDSLKAFVGEDYESPHIHQDEAELVAKRRIAHYDVVTA